MYYHVTKAKEKIKLCDLELRHLQNIIKQIERKAENGITIRYYAGITSGSADNIFYNEMVIFGKDVKKLLHYKIYKKELKRRKNL